MKYRPLILLTLLVVVPLALLLGIGWRLADREQQALVERFREVYVDRLNDVRSGVSDHLDAKTRRVEQLTTIDVYQQDQLREIIRNTPEIEQLFVIDPEGNLVHPDPNLPLNSNETTFLSRAAQIIADRDLQRAAEADQDVSLNNAPTKNIVLSRSYSKGKGQPEVEVATGWFTWYWGRGLNLIYWQRRPSGHIVAVTLERARWMADLIEQLPQTDVQQSSLGPKVSRVQLVDSEDKPVYQWGEYTPVEGAEALCEVRLVEPLSAWRLRQFVTPAAYELSNGMTTQFALIGGLSAVAIGLLVIAFLFVREYQRDIKEAAQRVSFVNQVSHELRTPLTNICMYSELLESDLETLPEEDTAMARPRLSVILSESQRLSRLIDNVLTFARQQRQTLQLKPRTISVDSVVSEVMEQFAPSLTQLDIQPELSLQAHQEITADPDAIAQILGNLISNVEKYAATGKVLKVTTNQAEDVTTLTVEDSGPGILGSDRARVFNPFWRSSDQLSDVAGTGIGLSIARDLAKLHGGDVVLATSVQGAKFVVTIKSLKEND